MDARTSTIYVGDSIVRKTDTILGKGKDVVVCLLGARIEHVTERVEKIMGRGNGGTILVHVGTNNADKEGTTAILKKYRDLLRRTKQARVCQIILSGILPVIGSRNQGYRNSRRMSINRLVQQLCKEEDVGFVEQLCGEGGDVYEGWTASERKRSWSVCRRLETGSRQWIGQRTLFKLIGQGGLTQSGQDDSSSNIRQGNAGLKCVSLNARSIMNKKNELNIMVNDSDPHIIGITESWANKDITDAELGLEGYVMFRKDRMGRRGGGVLLYVKDTIPAYEIQLREEADCEEAIWCKLVTGHKTVTMGVVYRCPNITKESNEKIQNAIREVSKGDCIIMGDFNHGNIQWDTLESTGVEDQALYRTIS